MVDQHLGPLDFIGSSREDLRAFPRKVRQDVGHALLQAQQGDKGAEAKPLRGFSGVVEIIDRFDGATYRAVYTVRFREVVYVLHCFQKKSKQAIKTTQQDIELIRRRLKAAEEDHRVHYL